MKSNKLYVVSSVLLGWFCCLQATVNAGEPVELPFPTESQVIVAYNYVKMYNETAAFDPDTSYALFKSIAENAKQLGQRPNGMEELIALREYDDEGKCHWSTFSRIDSLVTEQEGETKYINPYLEDCAEQQFLVCRDIFEKQLDDALANLDEQDKADLVLLDEKFIKPYEQVGLERLRRPVMPTLIGERLTSFFNDKDIDDLRDGTTIKWTPQNQDTIFRQINYINNTCSRIVSQTGDAAPNYNVIRLRPMILERVNDLAAQWVPRINLCHALLDIFNVIQHQRWRSGPQRWQYDTDNFASVKYASQWPMPF